MRDTASQGTLETSDHYVFNGLSPTWTPLKVFLPPQSLKKSTFPAHWKPQEKTFLPSYTLFCLQTLKHVHILFLLKLSPGCLAFFAAQAGSFHTSVPFYLCACSLLIPAKFLVLLCNVHDQMMFNHQEFFCFFFFFLGSKQRKRSVIWDVSSAKYVLAALTCFIFLQLEFF